MVTIIRDNDKCQKCGICVLTCPLSIFTQENEDSIPEIADLGLCVSCGHCVSICPQNAIHHSEYPDDSIKQINVEKIPSREDLMELLRTRRSTRVFLDRPVERKLIEEIIGAALYAPSAHNLQTTEYIVIQDKGLLEKVANATDKFYEKLVSQLHNPLIRQIIRIMNRKQASGIIEILLPSFENLLVEVKNGRDPVLRDAPVLMLFHADERAVLADINAQLALQNAALMAYAQGLGSFWTGYLVSACERDKYIRRLVNLPDKHKVYGGLAIGYPRFKFNKWPERRTPKITWL